MSPPAPTAVFDVIGTCFSLAGPRSAVEAAGAPSLAFDLWFAQSLRDAIALNHSGGYRPLRDVLEADLPRALRAAGVNPTAEQSAAVMGAFDEMGAQPGLADALGHLRQAGWRVVALTHGAADSTERLMARAGVRQMFSEVISAERIRRMKPHPDVYRLVLDQVEGPAWMVAAHAWDIAGAARAGMKTAFVANDEAEYPAAVFPAPDLIAPDLVSAARRMTAAPPGS